MKTMLSRWNLCNKKTGAQRCIRNVQQKAASSTRVFDAHDTFKNRHVGPNDADKSEMLSAIGLSSIEDLISETVPAHIRHNRTLSCPDGAGEADALAELRSIMSENELFRNHIGMGYYPNLTPKVILRNILENPSWYTPYTPYQPEISQGRMEMLLNFQTMINDLTGQQIANCSLLDESTAAAEAAFMCVSSYKKKENRKVFLVSDKTHPQTIAVLHTRNQPLGMETRVLPVEEFDFSGNDVCGALYQNPDTLGQTGSLKDAIKLCHEGGALAVVATDLLACSAMTPPGEEGADICVGTAQRFGVPLYFGGPHAGFLSCREGKNLNKRKMPGRLIGISQDSRGKPALRLTMQTREQHIRRDKATSNVCTAQALLANIAAAYSIYHGPEGLKRIAGKAHATAAVFAAGAQQLGLTTSDSFFDTVAITGCDAQALLDAATRHRINIRKFDASTVSVAFDETSKLEHVDELLAALAEATGGSASPAAQLAESTSLDIGSLARTSKILPQEIFNSFSSETEMMRYLYQLERKDLGLNTAMVPLGSCTMKLNAATQMMPVATWDTVQDVHPFAPSAQTAGYRKMLSQLEDWLADMTGFAAVSMQPNSGAQGEYAGLMCIRAYHEARGEGHRDVCLIPTSAHGTNPASAVFAGYRVQPVKCDSEGNIDVEDFRAKAEKFSGQLAACMITYPSTHGVFEETIQEICKITHDNDGQVYMDGANLNAQLGYCSPGEIGADVCHLNLHKTFAIPHGGGGPGLGPIGVAKQLAPFLPGHPVVDMGVESPCGTVCGAPWSSASIATISWLYIRMLGRDGLPECTSTSILSANYMANRLKDHYNVLYTGSNGRCAHEFILDLNPFKEGTSIKEEDVAKRLMDFGFHAPTMSWPVAGTLMVEPTESEPLAEMDRFCDAMIHIRGELQDILDGTLAHADSPLAHAPHTHDTVVSDTWDRKYSREQAAYPAEYLKANKFWPSVGRLDNVYGDKNVICSCPDMGSFKDLDFK